MNSIIEAQREFEEQRLKIRLLELRNLKNSARPKVRFVGLVDRAMKMSDVFGNSPLSNISVLQEFRKYSLRQSAYDNL